MDRKQERKYPYFCCVGVGSGEQLEREEESLELGMEWASSSRRSSGRALDSRSRSWDGYKKRKGMVSDFRVIKKFNSSAQP